MPTQQPKSFSGSWTVYRRKEDAEMWERFELVCIHQGSPPSAVLADLAREHVGRLWKYTTHADH